jgi:hypothetical protein
LTIKDRLKIDLSDREELPGGCLTGDQSLSDFVAGGTGGEIVCELPPPNSGHLCPLGGGNGEIPAGLAISESCEITGSLESTASGSFAWIVYAKQDGATVPVPFCVSQAGTPAHALTIQVSGAEQDDVLTPLKLFFDPASELVLANTSPLFFEARASCLPGECDRVAVDFTATCSPFTGSSSGAVSPVEILSDDADVNNGLSHPLNVQTTGPVDEKYRERPWVASYQFTYCTNSNSAKTACEPGADLRQTVYSVPLIAWPRTP